MEAGAVEHERGPCRRRGALRHEVCGAREGVAPVGDLARKDLLLALGDEIVRLDFPQPLTSAAGFAPTLLVELAQEARSRDPQG